MITSCSFAHRRNAKLRPAPPASEGGLHFSSVRRRPGFIVPLRLRVRGRPFPQNRFGRFRLNYGEMTPRRPVVPINLAHVPNRFTYAPPPHPTHTSHRCPTIRRVRWSSVGYPKTAVTIRGSSFSESPADARTVHFVHVREEGWYRNALKSVLFTRHAPSN